MVDLCAEIFGICHFTVSLLSFGSIKHPEFLVRLESLKMVGGIVLVVWSVPKSNQNILHNR